MCAAGVETGQRLRRCHPLPAGATTAVAATAGHAGGRGAPAQQRRTWRYLAQVVCAPSTPKRQPGGGQALPWEISSREEPQQLLPRVLLRGMSLCHATLQSRIPRPYLDIKEIDLIVSPLKQAFNSVLWRLKTLLNN